MNENERDTQFLEAATILIKNLDRLRFDPEGHVNVNEAQKLVANFLYDFVEHIQSCENDWYYEKYDNDPPPYDKIMPYLKDMTEWPDTSS